MRQQQYAAACQQVSNNAISSCWVKAQVMTLGTAANYAWVCLLHVLHKCMHVLVLWYNALV
jgi:hypothetical protein